MAARSRPEAPTPPPGVQVFSADTLADALAAAQAAHGPTVHVQRAQKVRRGVRGLLGRERYDVWVRPAVAAARTNSTDSDPAPTGEPVAALTPSVGSGDIVEDTLGLLLARADAQERSTQWSWGDGGDAPDFSDMVRDALIRHPGGPVDLAPHPAPGITDHRGGAALTTSGSGRGWSRQWLRELGVPPEILGRLPVEDPSDDAGWRRALVNAISTCVPEPHAPDEDHPVVVSGYGLAGAVTIMVAARDGATPGTISHAGRIRPATAAALTAVMQACVRS